MLTTLVTIWCLSVGHALPIVDPGVFVIMGVSSCREGSGYCLLGLDCTLDEDFLPDDKGGHCNGLRSAFTPSANFICCRYNSESDSSPSPVLNATSVILDNHLMDAIPAILLSMDNDKVDSDSTEMEHFTTEAHKTTTNVEEEVQLKSKAENNLALIAVLSDKGILSNFPSVTEMNVGLVVHERDVSTADIYTSTMDMNSENYKESEFKTQNQKKEQIESVNLEEFITTEANVKEVQDEESALAEHKDFESVSGATVPSPQNMDWLTERTAQLDLDTTEPMMHNEISEQTKTEASTTIATVGNNCWLVKFMNGTSIMCLGSFLSNNIILTAANCIYRVFDLGLDAVTLHTLGGTVIPRDLIRDVIVHEEYNKKLTLNDIGMIRLESPLKPTPYVCTLCLPNSESDLMDQPCDRMSKKYNNKKMLELPGSPMVCQGSTLGGVVSFYNPQPVYTPISDYLPWIRHNMLSLNIPLEWLR